MIKTKTDGVYQPWMEFDSVPNWWRDHALTLEVQGRRLVVADVVNAGPLPSGGVTASEVVYRDFRTDEVIGRTTLE